MAELSEQELELRDLENRHGPQMIGSVARYLLLIGLALIVLAPAGWQLVHGLTNPPVLELKLFGITWPRPAAGNADEAGGTAALPEPGENQTRVEGVVTFVSEMREPGEGTVYVNALRGVGIRAETVGAEPEPEQIGESEQSTNEDDPLLVHLRGFEAELESDSVFVEPYQELYNGALWLAFREGNRRVRAAGSSPLFFRPNLTALYARGPFAPMPISVSQPPPVDDPENPWVGPVAAITDFAEQLEARGIHLILAPVPHKTQIYPETLGLPGDEPMRYPWQDQLTEELAQAGVEVIDLVDPLWQRRDAAPLFLETDTHWTPTGMQVAAQAIARRVRQLPAWQALGDDAPALDRGAFQQVRETISNQGDLNRMLGLEPPEMGPPAETADLTKILPTDGSTSDAALIDQNSPVILMGDSYVNVFHASSLDVSWGDNAGLPEHLAWELGTPLSTVAINGSGQTAVRRQLIRKHGALPGKKVIIWVFNSRTLFLPEALQRAEADKWEIVNLPEPAPAAELDPEPETAPTDEFPQEFTTLVWAWKNRVPQPGAELQVGDRVSLLVEDVPSSIASEQKFDQTDFTLPQFYAPEFRQE